MTYSIVITNAQQLGQVLASFNTWAKARVTAGRKVRLETREEKRSLPQNARLHAALTDISRQVEWAGKKRELDVWKRLMVASWMRAKGESGEILPALDGHGVDVVYRHTSTLSKPECSELLEYLYAWGTEHGVVWSEVTE